MPSPALRLATRGSALARAQAGRVADLLGVDCELVIVSTTGDRRAEEPIWRMGGKGVFVKEVQEAVLDGRADAAVHSAKDLPSGATEGLVITAFPERLDPRDALVGSRLDGLATGARVATGSVRRRAQLAHERPDLTFAPLRGNIETRVEKAAYHDGAVMSYAALVRSGLDGHAAEVLDPAVMLPQVGQGALAVECAADDEETRLRLAAIDEPAVRRAVSAERAFLAELGGDCNLPAGALAKPAGDRLRVEGLLASLDGHVVLRHSVEGDDPEEAGRRLARELLDDRGGRALLGNTAA